MQGILKRYISVLRCIYILYICLFTVQREHHNIERLGDRLRSELEHDAGQNTESPGKKAFIMKGNDKKNDALIRRYNTYFENGKLFNKVPAVLFDKTLLNANQNRQKSLRTHKKKLKGILLEMALKTRIYEPEMVAHLTVGFKSQDFPLFLQYIRQRWMYAPSKLPYKLDEDKIIDVSKYNQATFVDNLLNGKEKGFFVECGAAEGEYHSSSLYLERKRGWNGLLIEANSEFHKRLLKKHRKCYSINACLSTENTTSISNFRPVGLLGGLDGKMDKTHDNYIKQTYPEYNLETDVQCFAFYSQVAALGVSHVDYFSLDIEGPELEVLKTIPFDKITINVISVKYRSWGGRINVIETMVRLAKFREFFHLLGHYTEVGILPEHPSKNKTLTEQQGVDVFFKREPLNLK